MFQLLLIIIYLSFISLGLPDALLGAAWPSIHQEFQVPVSYAGVISMIISVGTIISSLQSDRLTRTLGTGRVTAISVGMTAAALFGFSISTQFWMLCLWAIPYGLGAGSVDAALNNYVALHYKSRHMSWLHCMWGIGTMVSPMVMGAALTHGMHWTVGYRAIALFQVLLTVALVVSLPLWKEHRTESGTEETAPQALSLRQVFALPGAREVMLCFFCYCALETTAGLWASSYLTLSRRVPAETAASFASLFYFGITAGRAACGFITMKFNDTQMIRMGQIILAVGVAALLIPGPQALALAGLVLVGLGCEPIYPSIIHSTPDHFGADKSQAVIGIQMASAYVGNLTMPPLFGLLANNITPALFPFYLLALLVLIDLFLYFPKSNYRCSADSPAARYVWNGNQRRIRRRTNFQLYRRNCLLWNDAFYHLAEIDETAETGSSLKYIAQACK